MNNRMTDKELVSNLKLVNEMYPNTSLGDSRIVSIGYVCKVAAEKIKELQSENTRLKYEVEESKKMCVSYGEAVIGYTEKIDRLKAERDKAVEDLRRTAVFNNSCAFCKNNGNCDKQAPNRETVEPCWQWRGLEETDNV